MGYRGAPESGVGTVDPKRNALTGVALGVIADISSPGPT